MLCDISNNPKLGNLFDYVTCTINHSIIPLIFALATAIFIWGVVQYVMNGDEEAKKEKGRQFMVWGIIALTVMFGVWGLVAILGNTFGINTNALPQVQPPSGQNNTSGAGGPGGECTYDSDCPSEEGTEATCQDGYCVI